MAAQHSRRPSFRACGALAALALACAAPAARGQAPNSPHAGFAFPAGGQQGTSVRVAVGGRFLEGTSGAVFTARGLRAEIAGYDKPLNPRELTELRDKLQQMQKGVMTPELRREMTGIRARIGDSVRRNASPGLSEIVTLTVAIDADAEPGPWQLRLITPLGLTNPVGFSVGQVPEVVEEEPAVATPALAVPGGGRGGAAAAVPPAAALAPPQRITLPAVVNGRIIPADSRPGRGGAPRQPNQYQPGDADRFVFEARKGQDLVIAVSARDVMPYLADAVPGWFQATVALFDAAGREVAYDDDYRFQPDPVLHYRIPADGEYTVEIKDALYRGREDFVYRLSAGELPFVTSVFPLGGPARAKTAVQVSGWNLPTGTVTLDASGAGPGTAMLTVRRGTLVSNRVPFAVDSVRDVLEREPNDSIGSAATLTLPVIVNGRIQAAGDVDVFTVTGRAGEQVVAEITARRLGSPLDSVLELTDATGARLAVSDDVSDKGSGLLTHQADSRITLSFPANGTYHLRVGDLQRKGGPEYGYRLRVSRPQPDFELRVTPSEINAGAGTSAVITAHAIRTDGFAGDIVLSLKGAPPGFTLSGGLVPAGQDHVRLTVNVPPMRPAEPVVLGLEGRAAIQR
ncbi:MAG: PPC domain-containing protein [Vicinamibacterales bacterium]|nr:PPC domain-containing protein [Vicinamibacterales bacterium]